MPSKSWRKSTSLIDDIQTNSHRYSFVQLVSLLERGNIFRLNAEGKSGMGVGMQLENADKKSAVYPVGLFSPPQNESIRFFNQQSLTFPESEVAKVSKKIHSNKDPKAIAQWQVYTAFLGLNGAQGVLPYHYSRLVLDRIKQKDPTLEHFFNLFNHRSVSLFFQASIKYRLPTSFSRSRLQKVKNGNIDTASKILRSIVGLGTNGLENRLSFPDEAVLFYGGLFSQQVRSASGLQQIIASYFDVKVRVEEFLGRWQELIDDVRSRLPDAENPKGRNVRLGHNTMLGRRGWFAQGKARIVIGPVDNEQFLKFAPGTSALNALNELVRLYLGVDSDYDFKILVDRAAVPDKVNLDKSTPPIMGWNTWLSKPKEVETDTQALMTVSISPTAIN